MIAVRLAEFCLSLAAVVGVVVGLGVVVVRSEIYLRWRFREEDRADEEFAKRFKTGPPSC